MPLIIAIDFDPCKLLSLRHHGLLVDGEGLSTNSAMKQPGDFRDSLQGYSGMARCGTVKCVPTMEEGISVEQSRLHHLPDGSYWSTACRVCISGAHPFQSGDDIAS